MSVTSNLSLEGNIIIRQQKDATPQHFEKGQEEEGEGEEDKIFSHYYLPSCIMHLLLAEIGLLPIKSKTEYAEYAERCLLKTLTDSAGRWRH